MLEIYKKMHIVTECLSSVRCYILNTYFLFTKIYNFAFSPVLPNPSEEVCKQKHIAVSCKR